MFQIYVTEMPQKTDDCPFYSQNEGICTMSHGECCLHKHDGCKHLLTLHFDIEEVIE